MTLNLGEIEGIESQAECTLEEVFGGLDTIKLPIDINQVVDANGLILQKVHFVDRDVSGTFDRSKARIRVDDEDPAWRQAFTAAHELGHFKLHAEANAETFYRKDVPKVDGMSGLSKEEQEANWFAASLLMPRKIVERLWKLSKDSDELAEIFGVSGQAMRYRIKNLGLRS